MKRQTFFLLAALFAAMTASAALAQIKYVAVIETELDATSGAADDLSAAEVRQITAELRREAVENLPRARYNIMTSETVQAQGGAVLEECADENCVIILGSKIGADYIVRGIVSKFKTKLTLSIEMYETENGTLVASSDPVRSENAAELLERSAAACANMYKKFLDAQGPAPKQPKPKPEPKKSETESKSESKDKARIKLSYGGGAVLSNDFGGGLKWDNGERVAMPLTSGGAYLFFDAVYAEAFAGFMIGGGKWESPDVTYPNVLPYMSRSCVDMGVFVKYPVAVGNVKLFPLLGLGYEVAISGELDADGYKYTFDGDGGERESVDALNALWFKTGAGVETDLSKAVYMRAEVFYGARMANGFENKQAKADIHKGFVAGVDNLTVKIAAGVRF